MNDRIIKEMSVYKELDESQVRRSMILYRAQHAIWLWLGTAAILSCIVWFVDRDNAVTHTALGHALQGPLDDLWNIAWAVGGGMIAWGVWTLRLRAEFIGHVAVSGALAVNTMAIVATNGAEPQAFTIGGIAVASAFRGYFLWRIAPKRGAEE